MAPKLKQNMKKKEGKKKFQSVSSNDPICIQLDSDEDEPERSADYYDIGGERMQITKKGISSLEDGEYINDETINAAFSNIQKQFPAVHVFDTLTTSKIFAAFGERTWENFREMPEAEFNSHFGSMFLKTKSSRRSLPIDETFFSKKMLIFPIYHVNHWLLVIVVNPLLADVVNHVNRETNEETKDHLSAAYYVDSLMQTPKYTRELMTYRLDFTWRCIFSFLHLGALYHTYNIMDRRLIPCRYDNNIPSQENSFDCGPHTIINARLMANRFDELIKGPVTIEITEEEEEQVLDDVYDFRRNFKAFLESRKINPS